MNKIFLIFSNYSKLHFDIGKFLHSSRELLLAHGLQWQASFNNLWQNMTMDILSMRYTTLWKYRHVKSDKVAEERVKNLLGANINNFASIVDPEKDLVWFTGPMHNEAFPQLAEELSKNPVFAKRSIQTVLLLEKQDIVFMDRIKQLWKNEANPWLTREMASPGFFANYYMTVNQTQDIFGSENTHIFFLNPDNTLNEGQAAIENILQLPRNTFSGSGYPMPITFPGLDVTKAVFRFPFTKNEKILFDRAGFYELLTKVEQEEQFEKLDGIAPQALDYYSRFAESNRQLAKSLGKASLFSDKEYGAFPEQLPVLKAEQARTFVTAFPENLRNAFLRYFRDRQDALAQEELTFATALENYRKKNDPVSGFTFPRPKPVLSVLTMTRNHHKYIMECMESVSAQKTDFPIEHIIVDDASDDGNQDIIDNYASTHPHVRPIYLPSRSSGGTNIRMLFETCGSEFAALCDGDDYFSEPTKLQKQVDFLSKNPDCALCFHPVMAVYENNAAPSFIYPQANLLPRGLREKYYLSDIIKSNFIQTNSVVYRWRFRDGLPAWFRSDLCPSDWYWHILHAEIGKIGFIPEVMSIYRRHPASYYATSFTESSVNHRRAHGMGELKVYSIINEHFNNRYFRPLAGLANGVLSDFLRIMMENDDSSLLDEAVEKYPNFAKKFLQELKIVNKKEI